MNSPYNGADLGNIIRIIEGKKVDSTFNCIPRIVYFSCNKSIILECVRADKLCDQYPVPNIVSTKFSSNESLILGKIDGHCSKEMDETFNCKVSVERMEPGPISIIEAFSQEVFSEPHACDFYSTTFEISFPDPIIIKKNVKYKIELNISSACIYNNMEMKEKVNLVNGGTITFYRDESSDFNNLSMNVIDRFHFNKINF